LGRCLERKGTEASAAMAETLMLLHELAWAVMTVICVIAVVAALAMFDPEGAVVGCSLLIVSTYCLARVRRR
jgi:hypothetical protein